MDENKENVGAPKESVKDSFEQHRAGIQTLFGKLIELIMDSARTRKDVADLIVSVGSWAGMAFATLILMVEGNDQRKADIVAERIARSLQTDIKNNVRAIRAMKKKAEGKEESSIIVPDHLR